MTFFQYLLELAYKKYWGDEGKKSMSYKDYDVIVKLTLPKKEKIPLYLLEYKELLTRPEWLLRKKEIIRKGNFKCAHCHLSKPLEVHHKFYWLDYNKIKILPWLYPDSALIPLCHECHKLEHKKYKPKVYFISNTKLKELKKLNEANSL